MRPLQIEYLTALGITIKKYSLILNVDIVSFSETFNQLHFFAFFDLISVRPKGITNVFGFIFSLCPLW